MTLLAEDVVTSKLSVACTEPAIPRDSRLKASDAFFIIAPIVTKKTRISIDSHIFCVSTFETHAEFNHRPDKKPRSPDAEYLLNQAEHVNEPAISLPAF